MLEHSPQLCCELQQKVDQECLVYLLGDTSFAECCLDDVTASHAKRNDLIIKFGHSCLTTQEAQLTAIAASEDKEYIKNILYICEQTALPEDLKAQVLAIPGKVYIYAQLQYRESAQQLFDDCQDQVSVGMSAVSEIQILPESLKYKNSGKECTQILGLDFQKLQGEESCLLFIGSDTLLQNYVLTNMGLEMPVYHLNPDEATQQSATVEEVMKRQVNKTLMQRYANVSTVQESDVIGILVGTVVVSQYTEIIQYLKAVITKAGKKCYEVLVGKLNEPKLKNLPTIEMYCYIGCRETSIISTKEFMIPIATPHEVLMALLPDEFPWQCKIITDFQLLLPKLKQTTTDLSKLSLADTNQEETKEEQQDKLALVKAEHRELVPIFSVQVLQKYENQAFKGLDIATQKGLQVDSETGKIKVQPIQKGMVGIASKYH